DTLYGSAGNDLINTGGGTNIVDATQGGSDTIYGGSGNDNITAGKGANNLIVGNGGQDVLIAGNGNDNQIYADSQVDLSTALDQRSGTATGKKGDLIAVGDGNNTVVGGSGNDAIFTGTGDNTIVCGPGSDTVIGGVNVKSADLNWTVSDYHFYSVDGKSAPFTAPNPYYGNVFNGLPVGTGNDSIFGGTGNSTYFLSNGSNWLDAGGGDDLIQAGTGSSIIYGSEVNRAAAWEKLRCESTRAMVCGCSLWMNFASCWGSAFWMASKEAASAPRALVRRSSRRLAWSGSKARRRSLRAKSMPPRRHVIAGVGHVVELFEYV